MRYVIVEFEGTDQNVNDVLAGMPGFISNMGATFVKASQPEEMSEPSDVAPEAPSMESSAEATVTGGVTEEPEPGFLGENSEEEKAMDKE
jgi:hypothetical protein